MFIIPQDRTAYWRESFPYAEIQRMFAPMGWANVELGRWFFVPDKTETVVERNRRFPVFDGGVGSWRGFFDKVAPSMSSLHVMPDPLFLVFDLDLREAPQGPCRAQHPPRDVCALCWRHAVTVYDVLEDTLGRRLPKGMGLAPGLPVYSGGGGVHYWYHLPPDHPLKFRERRKDLLLDLVLRPQLAPLGIDLDQKVTVDSNHQARMPFSLHKSTGRIALPLSPTMLRQPSFQLAADPHQAYADAVQRLADWIETR